MRRLLTLLCLVLALPSAHADDWMNKRKIAKSFEETKDAVVLAIENRGLVINYTAHMADMLARTGADLGATRQIFGQAEVIEFCSASLSRKMLEIDPHNIVLCPFAIAIYTLPGDSAGTWVGYRRPPGAAAALVEPLLRDIATEAGQ